jgi:DoxX-like protein
VNIALWVTQIVLAWIYGSAAFRKLFQLEKVRANQEWARQSSDGYIRFIAISQLLGVAGMLFPILTGIFPWLTPLAAIGFCIIQILAAQWHIRLTEYKILPVNLFLFALSLFIAVGRWRLFGMQ